MLLAALGCATDRYYCFIAYSEAFACNIDWRLEPPSVFSRFLHLPPWIARLGFVRQVKPDSGFWKGASYHFTFTIPALYPHDPPKVSNVLFPHLKRRPTQALRKVCERLACDDVACGTFCLELARFQRFLWPSRRASHVSVTFPSTLPTERGRCCARPKYTTPT